MLTYWEYTSTSILESDPLTTNFIYLMCWYPLLIGFFNQLGQVSTDRETFSHQFVFITIKALPRCKHCMRTLNNTLYKCKVCFIRSTRRTEKKTHWSMLYHISKCTMKCGNKLKRSTHKKQQQENLAQKKKKEKKERKKTDHTIVIS